MKNDGDDDIVKKPEEGNKMISCGFIQFILFFLFKYNTFIICLYLRITKKKKKGQWFKKKKNIKNT